MTVENFTAVVSIGSFEKSKVSKSINDKEHEIGLVFKFEICIHNINVAYYLFSFLCLDNRHLSWEIFCYYAQKNYYHRGTI